MVIFKKNIKRILGNKVRFSILILAPILFVLIFAMGQYAVYIGIVDQDNSALSKMMIEEIKGNPFYKVEIIEEEAISKGLLSYELDYVIHFENGFEEKLINNESLPIKDYYFVENENVMNIKSYIERYINTLNSVARTSDGDYYTFYAILEEYQNSVLKTNNQSDNQESIQRATASIGFTTQFMIYMAIITCGLILEDRKNGTLARIFNSPIRLKDYLFQNYLSFAFVAFIQVTAVFLIYKFILNIYYGDGFFNILLLMYTFGLVSVSLGVLVVSLIKNPLFAYLTIGFLATPLVMLGGCYWSTEMMPEAMQMVGKFLPTSWVMSGAKEIFKGGNFFDIIPHIGILLLFGLVFFIGGIVKKNDYAQA